MHAFNITPAKFTHLQLHPGMAIWITLTWVLASLAPVLQSQLSSLTPGYTNFFFNQTTEVEN